jgi:cystathionine beta-synthase
VGTGGTISGTGRYLKEVSRGTVQVIGADPDGSVYSSPGALRPYLVEGVGQQVHPASFESEVVDEIVAIQDLDAILMTRRLAREEGLLTGGSGGMAVCAALQVAARLPSSAVVVVLLPDSGRGYLSKLFNDNWLSAMGFIDSEDPGPRVREVLHSGFGNSQLQVLDPVTTVSQALATIRSEQQPYLLVGTAKLPARTAEILGAVGGTALVTAVTRDRRILDQPVLKHMVVLPGIGAGSSIAEACETLSGAYGAAIVLVDGLVQGVVTATDLLAALASDGRPAHCDESLTAPEE